MKVRTILVTIFKTWSYYLGMDVLLVEQIKSLRPILYPLKRDSILFSTSSSVTNLDAAGESHLPCSSYEGGPHTPMSFIWLGRSIYQ